MNKKGKTPEEKLLAIQKKKEGRQLLMATMQKQRERIQCFRVLDIDDLFVMGSLSDGESMANIAKMLKCTPSAVTVRLHRYASSFGEDFFISKRNEFNKLCGRRELSAKGKVICAKAKSTLGYMLDNFLES